MNRKTNTAQKGWLYRLLPDGIQARLFLLIALALIPLLLLLAWNSYRSFESRRDQALRTELEVARGVATTFAAYVAGVQQQNYAVGQAIFTGTAYRQTDAMQLLTAAAANYPAVRNLSWVSPKGIVLISSLPDLVGRDLSVRPYFQEILPGKPWAIGDLTPSGISVDAPTLAIATAIRDSQGGLAGVVAAGIEPTRLGEFIFTQDRPLDSAYAIFDSQGVVVYRSRGAPLSWDDRTRWLEGDRLLQETLRTKQDQTGAEDLEIAGGEWVAARVSIADIGWVAGAERAMDVVYSSAQRALFFDVLTALLVWLLASAIAAILARTIARPLRRLESDVQLMDTGSILTRSDPQAPIEVRQVRGAVERMAASLTQRAEALRESEERFRVLFHNRHSPMLLIDPGTAQIVDANPAASMYYGWSREELVEKKITDINTLPPGQTQQNMVQARSSETSSRFHFRHRLASGEIRDVEVNSGPIQLGEKEYLFSIIHDITERIQAEAALREAHERTAWLARFPDENPSPVARVSSDGKILYRNQAMADLPEWECKTGQMIPSPLKMLLHQAITQGREVFQDMHIGEKFYSFSIAPFPEDFYVNVYGRDITERKLAEESLRSSEARLKRSQEISHLGSWELNLDNNSLTWSDEVYRIFGLKPQEFAATYEDFQEAVHPDDRAEVDGAYFGSIQQGKDSYEIEHRVVKHATGEIRTVYEKCEHVRDETGRVIRSIGMVHDITERKQAEMKLSKHTVRAELLANISRDFSEAGLDHHILLTTIARRISQTIGDGAIIRLLGEDEKTLEPVAVFHPDPQARKLMIEMLSKTHQFVGEGIVGEVALNRNPRLIAGAAPEEWIGYTNPEFLPWFKRYPVDSIFVTPISSRSRLIGILTVIRNTPTETFTQEDQDFYVDLAHRAALAFENVSLFLEEQQKARQMESLYEATQSLVETLDIAGLYRHILDAAQKAIPSMENGILHLFAPETGEVEVYIRDEIDPGIGQDVLETGRKLVDRVIRERKPFQYEEMDPLRQSGLIVPLILHGDLIGALSLISTDTGAFREYDLYLLEALAATATAVIHNARLHNTVQRLAETDMLTGLLNRRGFYELGNREIDRFRRYGHPLSIIMIDIDNFKLVNDNFGHSFGDEVLKALTEICMAITRKIDIAGRYGGDEFVILLPETDLPTAVTVARRIHQCFSERTFSTKDGKIHPTTSMGVTVASSGLANLEDLIINADRALYAAKEKGRNRVEILGN